MKIRKHFCSGQPFAWASLASQDTAPRDILQHLQTLLAPHPARQDGLMENAAPGARSLPWGRRQSWRVSYTWVQGANRGFYPVLSSPLSH